MTPYVLMGAIACTFHPVLRRFVPVLLVATLGVGLAVQQLAWPALVVVAILGGLVCGIARFEGAPYRFWLCVVWAVALTVALGMHAVPGFDNTLVYQQERLSELSAPSTLYLNLDKPLFALFYLWLLPAGLFGPLTALAAARRGLLCSGLALGPLILAGMASGYLTWDPKLPAVFPVWAANNLLLVAVGEEAFFRGFLQARLSRFWGERAGIAAASLVFGAAHFAGGPIYVALATVAGAAYGLAFARGGGMVAAVLCHFAVNATHFLLFSYPHAG